VDLTNSQANVLDALAATREPRNTPHAGLVAQERFLAFHGRTVNSLVKAGHLVHAGNGYWEIRDPRTGDGEAPKPGRVTTRRMDRYRRRYL
jgi:hypothetical protein